ncbi:MAG: TonB-dependent receptor [Flavobacteriaceae bacterium]|nr:TonB-dependent receptor [Flavobacteriaceae bacterium]
MKNITSVTFFLAFLFLPHILFSQNTITGNVKDPFGNPLFGANVLIQGTTEGTTTDQYGDFSIQTSQSLPLNIDISFIGYETLVYTVYDLNAIEINLKPGNEFDEIIVSASRKAEKLQEAPAAVSVISARQLSQSGGSISPLRALINTPGVDLQQQTGQRINIALRGGSSVFSTNVFPLLDYRSLISPGLEYFDSQNSPLNTIDLERIEVVLGPGSALYGPDVTTGVIHFISKDPFKYAGTTTELVYGERNTFKAAMRHAGHNKKETFGYKVNFRYGSGKDFTLNPDDPEDKKILDTFKTSINRSQINSDGNVDTDATGIKLFDVPQTQKEDYWASAANASLYFRPKNGMEIVTAGGWNGGNAIFYNDLGEGQVHGNEYWAQTRFNYKGWFAQTYYIKNDGGNDKNPTYLNRTGIIVPLKRGHYEAQLQYNFDFKSFLNSEWTVGIDYRNATAETQNHVYGRHENEDDYTIFGGYTQGKFKLDPKLDLFLSGRYDGYNFTSEKTFSPRAAFVYKLTPEHNFRLTYNKAANPIPASDIYFDLPIQTEAGILDVWVLGTKNPYTFASNQEIDWLIPGVPNTPYAAGFPLAAAFQAVTGEVLVGLQALAQDPRYASLAPLLPLVEGVIQNSVPNGFAPVVSQDTEGQPLMAQGGRGNLISSLTSYELGYKGSIGNRFAFGFNIFHLRQTGGAGFQQITPNISISSLSPELAQGVLDNALPQLNQGLQSLGFDPATAGATAALIGQQLDLAYQQAGQIFLNSLSEAGLPFHGVLPIEESPSGEAAKLIFGYLTRDQDRVTQDWGAEINTKLALTESWIVNANYSYFNLPKGEAGDLNFPQNKIRFGMQYLPQTKLSGSINYQYDQAYTSNNANYPGKIDAKSLFDATLGYQVSEGSKFELSATNLFNNEFRALPGFPKIGRTITARIVAEF